MEVFDVRSPGPSYRRGLRKALSALLDGKLVAVPTETVYGLAADASQVDAVSQIYAVKKRPSFNPLIIHVSDLSMAFKEGYFNHLALKLAEVFWPGPLTLIVPVSDESKTCKLVMAGASNVGVRMPNHSVILDLIGEFGMPLAAPSANLSGYISATSVSDIVIDFGTRVSVILDAGPARIGIESTIVQCVDTDLVVLRPGGVSREQLENVLGRAVPMIDSFSGLSEGAFWGSCLEITRKKGIAAPGMMLSHYAPRAPVRLNAELCCPSEAMLDFAGQCKAMQTVASIYKDLSPSGNLEEAGVNLFAYLRSLDVLGLKCIAVARIPSCDIGEAINDRLKRASMPRY